MDDVVIVDAARSPIGRARKGSLVDVRPDDLAGHVLQELLERQPAFDVDDVDDLICGVSQAGGEQGHNVGRVVGQLAGLPVTVPGSTVARACASSLQAIRIGYQGIRSGEGTSYIAAGVESVSRRFTAFVPKEHGNPRFLDSDRADFVNELFLPTGETAERVADLCGVTREDMDAFALLSHQRAVAAIENGDFAREIIPVTTPDGTVVTNDDGPRPTTSLETLASLKPAFRPDGRVTAGNSCPINDGAAALLMTSARRADELGLTARARILGTAVSGIAPEIMGLGPVEATTRLLDRLGMSISDVDTVELNEAFAAQVLPVCDQLGIDIDQQLNPFGGAIALGHPFGMTGVRMVTTLLNGLETFDGTIGIATLCVGGGQGMAVAVERIA